MQEKISILLPDVNPALFKQAGLNPDNPPTTWAQVETDATAIAKLGNGIEGWGDYSAGNNGGWHFSSYIDAVGGSMVNDTTSPPTASFNTADAASILTALHTLRFTDKAMSATQGLAWGTLQQQFAAGKLGMYIGAPDDIYNVIVPTDKGNLGDVGMGPLPSLTGTVSGSLSGGNDFMFSPKDSPAQIEAGIKWLNFEDLTPGTGQFNFVRQKADGFPVGFPEPTLFQGATENSINSLRDKSATINTSYYKPFRRAEPKFADAPLIWLPSTDGVLTFDRGLDALDGGGLDGNGRGGTVRCVANLSAAPVPLPPGATVLLASGPLDGELLPCDTTAWVRVGLRRRPVPGGCLPAR